jgi:hypothetical protein
MSKKTPMMHVWYHGGVDEAKAARLVAAHAGRLAAGVREAARHGNPSGVNVVYEDIMVMAFDRHGLAVLKRKGLAPAGLELPGEYAAIAMPVTCREAQALLDSRNESQRQ